MREFIRNIFGIIVSSYWGGLLFILFGLYLIYYTIKNPQQNPYSVLQGDMRGWAGGIGGIGLGILIIIMKYLGKV